MLVLLKWDKGVRCRRDTEENDGLPNQPHRKVNPAVGHAFSLSDNLGYGKVVTSNGGYCC